MAFGLRMRGRRVAQQKAIDVRYREEIMGQYMADLIVDDRIVVELKAVSRLGAAHKAQRLNYLRATRMRFAILLNFGCPRLEVRRIVSGY
jgi:GxxExxY protein